MENQDKLKLEQKGEAMHNYIVSQLKESIGLVDKEILDRGDILEIIRAKYRAERAIEEETQRWQKAGSKKLWLKGYNAYFIANLMDIPIRLSKHWVYIFESEFDREENEREKKNTPLSKKELFNPFL